MSALPPDQAPADAVNPTAAPTEPAAAAPAAPAVEAAPAAAADVPTDAGTDATADQVNGVPGEASGEAAPAEGAASAAPEATAKAREPRFEDTQALLAQHFPALFGPGKAKAIKLRIHADIQARAPQVFTRKALAVFFSRYTNSTAYLRALAAPEAQRHDLDGQPVGVVEAEHQAAAATEVTRRQAIIDERIQAARQAQREKNRAERPPRAPRPEGAAAGEGGESGEARAPREPRGDRPPRGPRREGEERPARAPRREGDDRPRGPRPEGGDRPPRREGERGPRREGGADRRGPRPEGRGEPRPFRDGEQRRGDSRPDHRSDARHDGPPTPRDPAQRDRANLLWTYDKNVMFSDEQFAKLKGLTVAQLQADLALARQERSAARGGKPEA